MKKQNMKKLIKSDKDSFGEISHSMKNAWCEIRTAVDYNWADVFKPSEIALLENMAKRLQKMVDDIADVEDEDFVRRYGKAPF